MNIPQQTIPLVDQRNPGFIAKPWYDFLSEMRAWIRDRPTPAADGTYNIDGSSSGSVATITLTDGVITGVTTRP